jgi:hypothetical protein
VLAPGGLNGKVEGDWVKAAYQSWWAGSNHLPGLILYCAAGFLGIYVVLMQNVVGVVTVYLIVALSAFADFGMVWENPDGHFGWLGVTAVYKTVLASLALHGFALSFLFVVLGTRNFRWLVGLLILWALVLPLFTVVPWRLFGKIGRKAVEARIAELAGEIREAEEFLNKTDHLMLGVLLRQEIGVLRGYRTMILRPRPFETSLVFGTIVLPLVLALGQILFAVQFGAH